MALLAGIAAGIVFAVVKLRHVREVATQAVGDIEAQIDALDPVTRAAVVAKLAADAAKDVKAKKSLIPSGKAQGASARSRLGVLSLPYPF